MAVAQRAAPAQAVLTDEATPRLVVKYRDARIGTLGKPSAEPAGAEATAAGNARYKLHRVKVTASGAVVYHLGQDLSLAEARAAAARIARDPAVVSAEPDLRVQVLQTAPTNDPYSSVQWPLMARAGTPGAADFVGAWARTRGAGVLVGDIDSGGLPHADLAGQSVTGHDFVSADTAGTFNAAGDGDGRDYDPTDPGDFCSTKSQNSTWHGTKVASLIAALADNGQGISGAAPSATVMQIRAVGRCGGFLSDIADALTWSVGAPVTGVPTNTTPVKVVNLSVGAGTGTTCPAYMQNAVNAATSRGVPVIVAAGNDGLNSVGAPASCSGVIVVGSHTSSGDLSASSNRSAALTVTAPGGGSCAAQTTTCVSTPTVSLGNNGLTTVGTDVPSAYFSGTSAAAPHVAAAVALIRAVAPALTPTEIKAILVATAREHATDSFCAANRGVCGAGMLDANAAVNAALTPVLAIAPSYTAPFVAGGTTVSLAATVTAGMGSTYAWTQVSGTPVTLSGVNTATVSFKTPAVGGNLVFRADATTSLGGTLALTQTVVVNNAPTLTSNKFSVLSGTALSGKLVAADADGDTVTFTLVDGPVGLTLQGDTLVWTAGVTGDFTVSVDMVDSRGASSRASAVVAVTGQASGGGSGGSGNSGSEGGGGGGSTDLAFLGLMAGALLIFTRRKR